MELTLSKKAIYDLIITSEVTSQAYYNNRLQRPMWPGGMSGVTMGIGYDVGTVTVEGFSKDWIDVLAPGEIKVISKACGILGANAKRYLPIQINITWEMATAVFYRSSLINHAYAAVRAFPDLELLHPVEITAIVGLVYVRGSSLKGARRKEMAQLVDAIKADNDGIMAGLIRQMKRLWTAKQSGLWARMEKTAQYIEMVDIPLDPADALVITL